MPIVSTVRGSFGSQGRFGAKKIGLGSTGGTITTSGGYRYHTFTSGTSTFTPDSSGLIELLVVAGGGGGGRHSGGGGGAGGLIYGTAYPVASTGYTVTVGAGAPGENVDYSTASYAVGENGSNSIFGSLTAVGGGGGGYHSAAGAAGGSGGGGGRDYTYGSASQTSGANYTGYGNNGGGPSGTSPSYSAAGGGGAGAAGSAGSSADPGYGGAGGTGISVFGSYYAGGGGGNIQYAASYGSDGNPDSRALGLGGNGGNGGGGKGGGPYSGTNGSNDGCGRNGTANTGGGGGAHRYDRQPNVSGRQAAGGSGIVIVRYAI